MVLLPYLSDLYVHTIKSFKQVSNGDKKSLGIVLLNMFKDPRLNLKLYYLVELHVNMENLQSGFKNTDPP